MADIDANLREQQQLYGEPLGAVIDRCRGTLGLTQSRVAALLGISAPMLSQVMSGQRIKIGNPSAVQRLQTMVEAVGDVDAGDIDVATATARIEAAGAAGEVLTGATRRTTVRETAAAIQAAFRDVAGANDFLAAADLISGSHPEVARLLRVYGASRLEEAAAYMAEGRGRH